MGVNWDKLLNRLVTPPVQLRKALATAGDTSNFDRYSETDEAAAGGTAATAAAGSAGAVDTDGGSAASTVEDPFAEF